MIYRLGLTLLRLDAAGNLERDADGTIILPEWLELQTAEDESDGDVTPPLDPEPGSPDHRLSEGAEGLGDHPDSYSRLAARGFQVRSV